jgi:murein DD-endopeptidase MepM/ murein hydrolase activator NlpD
MEGILPAQLPPVGTLLQGKLDVIQRMDANNGRVAAARELQVAFFTQLIEAMRRTIPENSLLPRSPTRDVYDGLFDRELANAMVARDPLGLVARLGGSQEEGSQMLPKRPYRSEIATVVPPLKGALSSPYGPRRDPITGLRRVHHGMDLAAPAGTPIRAVATGRVLESGWAGPAGYRVMIEHADGYRSVYAHARRALVDVDDVVVAGQVIATVGSSGRATGPHLHFEVHRNGASLDPAQDQLTGHAMRQAVRGDEI